jgi:DivIVA domain-containing protein
MTTDQDVPTNDRGLTPADLHNVRFTRASMLRPGYVDTEVDRVLSRVAEELGRLYAEKAALRDQVRSLQAQVDGVVIPEAPSEQAVRILSSAQLTADNYVAEAEEFSRQVTAEARAQYEEVLREARETAGAILQSAQEAAARRAPTASGEDERDLAALQEQVAYLKAFGQATRTQLRAYLEALLSDVEKEWGRADPAALPSGASLPPAQRQGSSPSTTFEDNSVAAPVEESVDADVAHVVSVRE